MKMTFWFGTNVGDYLIYGLTINSVGALIGVCLFIGVLAFMFEYLRYLQAKHRQRELLIRAKQIRQLCPTESATLLAQTITNPRNPYNISVFDRCLLFTTEISIWLLLLNMGYILMLSVMLYDVWFIISAVLGGGLGYFVFGQKFMKLNLQNCRIIREAFCTQICGETDDSRDGESTPAIEHEPCTSRSSLSYQQDPVAITAMVHSQCHS